MPINALALTDQNINVQLDNQKNYVYLVQVDEPALCSKVLSIHYIAIVTIRKIHYTIPASLVDTPALRLFLNFI